MLTEDPVLTTAPTSTRTSATRTFGRAPSRRRRKSQLRFLLAGLVIVAAVGYMIYSATQSGSEFFLTTSELLNMGDTAVGQQMKIGGRVVEGSVQWDRGANSVAFNLADEKQSIPVVYRGVVPDTFQAGTDVIVEGKLGTEGQFQATALLTKCASKYEPAKP